MILLKNQCFLAAALLLGMARAAAQTDGEAPPVRVFEPYRPPVVQVADTPTTANPARPAGQLTVVEDPRIEQLMRLHAETKHVQKGYRVQIHLGDRRTAEETKRLFLQKYPDTPAYLSWLAPNFRLRVGDLRTRLEAEHLLRQLRAEFPGSYIVPDEIEPPRLPE